jgi:hypothetical protein
MATKVEIGTIRDTIKDPMLSDNFLFEISSVPTGTADAKPLMVQCQSATLPGCTINNVDVQLFGHTLTFAGNKTFSHDISITFVENVRGEIRRIFERWAEMIRTTEGQLGSYKAEYSTNAVLTVLDQKDQAVLVYTLYGCWPSSVPDTAYEGTAANLITHQITLKYDYYLRTGGATS